jgi:hypothetical protein
MRGDLTDPADLEWLLAWIRSSPEERLEFTVNDQLTGLQFIANEYGLQMSAEAWGQLAQRGSQLRCADLNGSGRWVGLN